MDTVWTGCRPKDEKGEKPSQETPLDSICADGSSIVGGSVLLGGVVLTTLAGLGIIGGVKDETLGTATLTDVVQSEKTVDGQLKFVLKGTFVAADGQVYAYEQKNLVLPTAPKVTDAVSVAYDRANPAGSAHKSDTAYNGLNGLSILLLVLGIALCIIGLVTVYKTYHW